VSSVQMVQNFLKEKATSEYHEKVMRDGYRLENKVEDWNAIARIVQQILYSLGLCLLISQSMGGVYSVICRHDTLY